MVRLSTNNGKAKPLIYVVAALIWQNDRFLACHRTSQKLHGNKWEFVGGKIEAGESPKDALKRECREELKIEVDPIDVFVETEYEYPDMKIHMTVINTKIVSGVPQLTEHDNMKWISVTDISKYDFSYADCAIIEKIQRCFGGNR